MNKTGMYSKWALWLFILAIITAFAIIYAFQTGITILLYGGTALVMVVALALTLLVIQSKNISAEMEIQVTQFRKREKIALDEKINRRKEDVHEDNKFNLQEKLAGIVPSPDEYDDCDKYTEKILQNFSKELNIVQGLAFVLKNEDKQFHVSGEYAYYSEETPRSFPLGETLSGQVAKNRQLLNVPDLPDRYITILSGLGKGNPRHLVIVPIVCGMKSIGIFELASFKPFGANEESLIREVAQSVAEKLNALRK